MVDSSFSSSQQPQQFSPGAALDRYVVISELGAGGMGVVYEAYDPKLERRVAVKMLHFEQPREGDTQGTQAQSHAGQRLLREAKALAKLAHPNVLTIYDVGMYGGTPFISTELVDGQTMHAWLGQRRRNWREVLEVMIPAGRGLAAAHRAGLVHRDFKPDNVIIGRDGRILVLDFGLVSGEGHSEEGEVTAPQPLPSDAALPGSVTREMATQGRRLTTTTQTSELTRVGAIMGTPSYMAPEQHMGRATGPKADQFGFCVSLFEALYGCKPFVGRTPRAIAQAAIGGRISWPKYRARVPRWLTAAIQHGLRANPARRFDDLEQLLDLLDRRRRPNKYTRPTLLAAALTCTAGVLAAGQLEIHEACEGKSARLGSAWDEASRASARSAFARVDLPYSQETWTRLELPLADYRNTWFELFDETCNARAQASGIESRRLDTRMECLRSSAREFRSLTRRLESAGPRVIQKAVENFHQLPPLLHCTDDEALAASARLPDDPRLRRRVGDLRVQLAEIRELAEAGQGSDARAQIVEVSEEAARLEFRPLLAEVHALRAEFAQDSLGDEEIEHLRAAFNHAIASGYSEVAASSANRLFFGLAYVRNEIDRAGDLLRQAEVLIQASGERPDLMTTLQFHRGVYHGLRSEHEQSLAYMRSAHEYAVAGFGEDSFEAARALGHIADAYTFLFEFEKELEMRRRAMQINERLLGDSHPEMVHALARIAQALAQLGQFDEALATALRSVSLCSTSFGPRAPNCANAYEQTSRIYQQVGDYARADADLAIIAEMQVQAGNRLTPWMTWAHSNRARLALRRGHYPQASSLAREGLERIRREHKPDPAIYAGTLRIYARAQSALGQFDAARATLQQAWQQLERPSPNGELESISLTVDEASIMLEHGQAQRALELLERARKALGSGQAKQFNANLNTHRARALYELGRSSEAIAIARPLLARQVVSLGPGAPQLSRLHTLMGDLELASSDDAQTALEHFEAALAAMAPEQLAEHLRAEAEFGRARAQYALRAAAGSTGMTPAIRAQARIALEQAKSRGHGGTRLASKIRAWLGHPQAD